MPDVINELAERTALPPASVRRVMDAFAGLADTLGEGDRAAIARDLTLVCRHRETEGGERRRVLVLRKRKRAAEGPEEAA